MSDQNESEFVVTFGALLRLLVATLYRDPTATIRELLSNASTALGTARIDDTLEGDPQIRVWLEAANDAPTYLLIQDNGVGMTESHLHKCLGEVGEGFARLVAIKNKDDPEAMQEIIGKYGIGFLSSFIIADQVTVLTRHAKDKGRHWTSDAIPDEALTDADWKPEKPFGYSIEGAEVPRRGTTVRLRLRDRYVHEWDEAFVRRWVLEHARHFKFSIYWGQTGVDLINEAKAPWYAEANMINDEESLRSSLVESGTHFANAAHALDFIRLHDADIRGVLYISLPSDLRDPPPCHLDIYCKRVFVKHDERELIPPEFRFLCGVVDCFNFELTTGREDLRTNGLNNMRVSEFLGQQVLDHLASLAEQTSTPEAETSEAAEIARLRLQGILSRCHPFLKHALVLRRDNGEFKWGDRYLEALGPFMPFYTGELMPTTVTDYLHRREKSGLGRKIEYVLTEEERIHLQSIDTGESTEFLWLGSPAERQDRGNEEFVRRFATLQEAYLERYAQIIGVPCQSATIGGPPLITPEPGWQDIINFCQNRLDHPEFSLSVKLANLKSELIPGLLLRAPDEGHDQLSNLIKALEREMPDNYKEIPLYQELQKVGLRQPAYLFLNRRNQVLQHIAKQLAEDTPLPLDDLLHPIFHDIVAAAGGRLAESHVAMYQARTYSFVLKSIGAAQEKRIAVRMVEEERDRVAEQLKVEREKIRRAEEELKELNDEVARLRSLQPVQLLKDEAFFIRPMKDKDPFFDYILKKIGEICMRNQLTLIDPNQMSTSGEITTQIIEKLRTARLVVADISPVDNTNVYYEVGFVAGNQPDKLVLIASEEVVENRKIPFDFITTRMIPYPRPADLFEQEFLPKVERMIGEVLRAVKR